MENQASTGIRIGGEPVDMTVKLELNPEGFVNCPLERILVHKTRCSRCMACKKVKERFVECKYPI